MIPIGVCQNGWSAGWKDDYVEVGFGALATMTEESFTALRDALRAAGAEVHSANGMLAPGILLPERDRLPDFGLGAYLETGYSRMRELGGSFVVLGSGKARDYAENETEEIGMRRFARFAAYAAKRAGEYGLRVVIEPLNREETNVVHTVTDAYRICELAGFPERLGVLADLYHVAKEEPLSDLYKVRDRLWHCHIACPSTRHVPLPGDGGEDLYRELFDTLNGVGYTGKISIEAGVSDKKNPLSEFRASVAYLHELQKET